MAMLLAVTLGFNLRLGVPIVDSLFGAFLLVTLPTLSLAQLRLLAGVEVERLRAYVGSALTIVLLASLALVLGALGPGLPAMGLGAIDAATLGRTAGLLAAGAAVLIAAFWVGGRVSGAHESPLLRQLIPRTGPERRVFAGLSVAAGFGEELVYRGYLLALLTPALGGAWVAAGVTSAAFGVLHAYQGAAGIARTGLLGLLFAASVVETGSLWPAVLVHTAVDLVGGLWLGPRLDGDGASPP
jgi:membrane protease YdiL (CAAX protease family)